MTFIKNTKALATTPARSDALKIIEAGLQSIDTATVLRDSIKVAGNLLQIQGRSFNLSAYKNVYIVGFGKVACTAAHTLEAILEGRVKDGAVIGVAERVCQVVDTYAGTHPLPSQQNYTATKHIEEVARRATADDLVLVIVSGGGSALLCSSMGECEQGTQLFGSFLQSGGTIEELNIVRKHISHLKGGGLAKALYPATVVGLIFSDVPGGDMAAVASGPTCFDTSTIHDAEALITKYNLGEYRLVETPKDPKYFERVYNLTIVSNVTALNAMQRAAESLGYRAQLVSATQYATADETKERLHEGAGSGLVQVIGGETKVTVPAHVTGKGGRNGYLTLTMLESLQPAQVFVSLASDGHDNTPVAGAIVDESTLQRARTLGLSIPEYLETFNSYSFFDQVGGHVDTGLLASNVADLSLLLTRKVEQQDAAITEVTATIIKDSRNKDTIAVTVKAGVYSGTFAVPSGASTGVHEVTVLPPVEAVAALERVARPALLGLPVVDQAAIDAALHTVDGTDTFARIGGNLALGVSVAACKAAAAAQAIEPWQHVAALFAYQEQSLAPRLFVNLINGGQHATAGSPIQEHQIIPDTYNIEEALAAAKAVQAALQEILHDTYQATDISIGDEGGFAVPSHTLEAPFTHLEEAIKRAGTAASLWLGADIAASSFYRNGTYELLGTQYTTSELLTVYDKLHERFPMLQTVEDPYDESDTAGFAAYHQAHPGVLTIGDDLTTTNREQLQEAIDAEAINALIIKPNQIGTLTDTLSTMQLAYQHKVWCIVSHRSGETDDDFIADLAWGTKCYGFKAGAPNKLERAIKYNRLLTLFKS